MLISRRARLSLRAVALLYLALLLLLPVAVVFIKTFEHGFGVAWGWMTTPAAVSALWLTLLVGRHRGAAEHHLRDRLRTTSSFAGGDGRRRCSMR